VVDDAGQAHPNVARVVAAAAKAGLTIQVERFPEGTRTAADAARAVGCDVAQIVKSLVFMADGNPVLALLSGAGFAIGGVPPIGHAGSLTVLIDQRLLSHDVVWAAAGLPDAVFRVSPIALQAASGARLAALAVTEDAP